VTQEFHISVTPVGGDRYLVRTERVAQGAPLGEEQIIWPVADWLEQARRLMNDPLTGLLQGSESGGTGISGVGGIGDPQRPVRNLVELGQQLNLALFQGTLRDSWMASQGIAHHLGQVLRLRLGLKGDQLPRLPWEVMQGGEALPDGLSLVNGMSGNRPVATGTNVVFSRYRAGLNLVSGSTLPPGLEPGQPLRILLAIAAPADRDQLELEKEALQLQAELCHRNGTIPEAGSIPDIEVKILHQPGREQLTHELEYGNYQILHYAGHSDLGSSGGCLYLVNDRTGLTETLSGDDLAGLLVSNKVHIAVFNSCRGAYTATEAANNGERNLTEALISRGVPAVLAMAETIPDNVALNLSRWFYRNLKQGYPIDLSLSRARQALISSYGSQQLYWALPVLYLHQDFDGYLKAGDRDRDNPADQLLSASKTYNPPPLLSEDYLSEEHWLSPPQPTATSEQGHEEVMMSEAILADADLSDLVGKSDYDAHLLGEEDLAYEEDQEGAAVAELIQQLSRSQSDRESMSSGGQQNILLSDTEHTPLDVYSSLPDNPAYPPPPGSALVHSGTQTSPSTLVPRPTVQQPDAPSIPPAEATPKTNNRGRKRDRHANRSRVIGLGLAGIVAVGLAVVLIPRLLRSPGDPNSPTAPPPESPLLSSDDIPADLTTANTNQLTGIAITTLSRNDLDTGLEAVSILLDRGNLNQAQTALDAIPQNQLETAAVRFMRGRLAWEFVMRQNLDYSLDDVQRLWEGATQADPGNVQYLAALGTAYYAAGNLEDATTSWCRVVEITAGGSSGGSSAEGVETFGAIASATCPVSDTPPPTNEVLQSYAGLALVLAQQAAQTSSTPIEDLHTAQTLQRVVLRTNPDYAPDALGDNWLWTEAMANEWDILLRR
jgi:hypothetical protein